MGIIFGKRGCNEDRDKEIRIYFVGDENPLTVAEQLTDDEAEQMYDKIKEEFDSKSLSCLEFEFRGEKFLIPKNNISCISIRD